MLVLVASACTSGSSTTTTPTPARGAPTPSGPIKHIVFLVKENRTFDNYFGTYPGVNGVRVARDSAGLLVPLQHEQDVIAGDIDHSSGAAKRAYDNGKMDGFDQLPFFSAHTSRSQRPRGPYDNNSLTQFYQSDIPNYWTYARNFVLSVMRAAHRKLQTCRMRLSAVSSVSSYMDLPRPGKACGLNGS
jgi:phospholipase C